MDLKDYIIISYISHISPYHIYHHIIKIIISHISIILYIPSYHKDHIYHRIIHIIIPYIPSYHAYISSYHKYQHIIYIIISYLYIITSYISLYHHIMIISYFFIVQTHLWFSIIYQRCKIWSVECNPSILSNQDSHFASRNSRASI